MKRYSCLVIVSLLFFMPAQAQRPAQTKSEDRILYSRNIPTTVHRQVPRGGKTKFFGVWKPEKAKHELLVHFYSAPTKEEPLLCKVDIFKRPRAGRNSYVSSRMKRINSVRLEGNPTLFEYVTNKVPNTVVTLTYGASVIWANLLKKQVPLLRFHIVSTGGLHGDYGDYVLVNFPHGWGKEANVQYFRWGGGLNYSDTVSFNAIDVRGYMVIATTHTEYNDIQSTDTVQAFHWDGWRFSQNADNWDGGKPSQIADNKSMVLVRP